MKISQIIGIVSGITVLSLGAIAIATNPTPQRYERYAGKTISTYLKDNVCQNAENNLPKGLQRMGDVFQNYCKTLVEASQEQLGEIIGTQTSHQNFVFLSLYKTDIELPDPLPHYSFDTVGAFNHFYTYRAQKR